MCQGAVFVILGATYLLSAIMRRQREDRVMHRGNISASPRLAAFLLGGTFAVLSTYACSDSTGPSGPVGLLKIDAWACPRILPPPTAADCFRQGLTFDPAVTDSANHTSLMIVTLRRENGDAHRIIVRVFGDGGQEITALIFPPVESLLLTAPDVFLDTVVVPPISRSAKVRVVMQLAAGDTLPFLRLVDDTTFFWF